VKVRELPADANDDLLHRVWSVTKEAQTYDRPYAVFQSFEAFNRMILEPQSFERVRVYLAEEGEQLLGTALTFERLRDNTHLADLEVAVDVASRGAGVGTALHQRALADLQAAGRSTMLGEVFTPLEGDSPAMRFALARGYESAHAEHHLVAEMEAENKSAAALADKAVARSGDYEVVTWQDSCPDEYVKAFCRLRTQMSNDVPVGDLDWEPVQFDEARLRAGEALRERSWHTLVAVARHRATQALVGYSLMLVPRDENHYALQDDTLVMPEHRGHSLGLLLKLSNQTLLRRDHPHVATLHTYTDPTNTAMYHTNLAFGYRPVEVFLEMQLKLAPEGF
jgi:GNAT superfamily N-acetyltransferase